MKGENYMWKTKIEKEPLIIDPKDWSKEEYQTICKLFGMDDNETMIVLRENYSLEYEQPQLMFQKEEIKMKAVNIKWDTDGDLELLQELPKGIKIPEYLVNENANADGYMEDISDYITDVTGFCHYGFALVD